MDEETKNLNNSEEELEDKNLEQSDAETQVEGGEKEEGETLTKEQFAQLQKEKKEIEERYKALQAGFTRTSQENAELKKLKEQIEAQKKLKQEFDEATDIEHYIKKYPNDPYKGLNEWRKACDMVTLKQIQIAQYQAEAQHRVEEFRDKLMDKVKDEKKVNEILVKTARVINEYGLEFTPKGIPRKDALQKAYKIVKAEEAPKTKEEIKEELKKEEEQKKQRSLGETATQPKEKKTKEQAYKEFLHSKGGKSTKL